VTEPLGPARILDDEAGVTQRNYSPFLEVGRTGLRRVSGIVQEEFLPQLRGRKAVQVYREMSENDAIVGALIFSVERLLRQLEWRVEAASNNPDDKANAEFVEQCMDDMSHSWDDLVAEILSMLVYGWSWHYIVYKKRIGPWEKDPKKRSKHSDGKIGWRKMPIRSQETLFRWGFDDDGGIKTMFQMAPPQYDLVSLDIERSLLFRTTTAKNNPEGFSLLRRAYRSWFLKKRLEEFESIGVERDLAGLPVARVPSRYLDAKTGTKEAQMVAAFRKMVQSVRRDENEGIVLPSEFDFDTKQQLFDFELMTSGGSRQFDTNALIQRYEQRILMSCLADFILVGHEETGSYSMHTDKRGLFQNALNSISHSIAEVFNRYAIPRLFSLNGVKPNELPTIVPNDVDPPDIMQLGGFMQQMVGAGMQFFPDPELEKFIRDAARLPKLDPEQEETLEIKARQQNIMDLAQQRLDALGMEIQAHQGIQQVHQGQLANDQQQAQFEADPTGQGANLDPTKQINADNAKSQGSLADQSAKNKMKHEGDREKVRTTQARDERDHGRKIQSLKVQQERQKLLNMRRQQNEKSAAAKKKPAPKGKK
jgi:hypothetical protein